MQPCWIPAVLEEQRCDTTLLLKERDQSQEKAMSFPLDVVNLKSLVEFQMLAKTYQGANGAGGEELKNSCQHMLVLEIKILPIFSL